MTETSEVVLVDVRDGVATITLNRPDARNALSLEVLRALPRAVRSCDERDDVRTYYLVLRWKQSRVSAFDFRYEFENSEYGDFHTLRLGATWQL